MYQVGRSHRGGRLGRSVLVFLCRPYFVYVVNQRLGPTVDRLFSFGHQRVRSSRFVVICTRTTRAGNHACSCRHGCRGELGGHLAGKCAMLPFTHSDLLVFLVFHHGGTVRYRAPVRSRCVPGGNGGDFSRLLCLTTLGSRVPLLLLPLLLLLLLLSARLLVCCCWCTLLCWFARCVNAGGEHSRDRERGRVHESGHGEHQGFERLQVQWGDLFFYVCALPHAVLSWAWRVGIFVSKTPFRTRGGCKNLGIDRARLSQLKKNVIILSNRRP